VKAKDGLEEGVGEKKTCWGEWMCGGSGSFEANTRVSEKLKVSRGKGILQGEVASKKKRRTKGASSIC